MYQMHGLEEIESSKVEEMEITRRSLAMVTIARLFLYLDQYLLLFSSLCQIFSSNRFTRTGTFGLG